MPPLPALRRPRRAVAAAGVAVLGCMTVAACSGGSNAVDQTADGQFRYVGVTPTGKTIPAGQRKTAGDASAPYLDGGTFTLAALKGKVVVLNYWATWCAPCVTETPGLERTYTATKAQGVDFVGIAVKTASKSQASSFVADNHVTYPIVWDEIGHTAIQLGHVPTFNLPSTVVIDRQGRVAAVYNGLVQQGDLQPVLVKLAAEK